jgi:hypothetical protein
MRRDDGTKRYWDAEEEDRFDLEMKKVGGGSN